jgi:SAM-dependent methyltransferase
VPEFQHGHNVYVETVKARFQDGCCWLEAGGGRRIFHDLEDGERELVQRATCVVACDCDVPSLAGHASVDHLVCGDLARLPFASNTFDFITCAMVVEHLKEPGTAIKELGRVLAPGGRLIIHTVNYWGYPTLLAQLSKMIPFGLRRRLIARITKRQEVDIFPTYYRCNTAGRMRRLLEQAGLKVEELRHESAGILFPRIMPAYLLEMLYIKLTLRPWFAGLRGQLLVTAVKPQ